MKKIIIAILGFFIIISLATAASAGDGDAQTFGDLTFNPSASTSISAVTTVVTATTPSYTIISGSSKAGDNCIEYGIISTYNVIYQRTILDDSGYVIDLADSATLLPGGSWETKSGSTPPSS